jgi:DNA-binding XRE family transcriptional regulator
VSVPPPEGGGYGSFAAYGGTDCLSSNPVNRDTEIFGRAVRELWIERGRTQEELADAVGLTATYVGQVERGDKVARLTVVLKLARGLAVVPSELLRNFSPSVIRNLKL